MKSLSAQRTIKIRALVAQALPPYEDQPISGAAVAKASGLSYKQTIDALNALYNLGRADRVGRKTTAKWRKSAPNQPKYPGLLALERIFLGLEP